MKLLLFAIILLSGCATPQERAEKHMAKYGPYCSTLGFEEKINAMGGMYTVATWSIINYNPNYICRIS